MTKVEKKVAYTELIEDLENYYYFRAGVKELTRLLKSAPEKYKPDIQKDIEFFTDARRMYWYRYSGLVSFCQRLQDTTPLLVDEVSLDIEARACAQWESSSSREHWLEVLNLAADET